MSKSFRPWTIDQPLLLPAIVQDFVGADHLARFVLALVYFGSSALRGNPTSGEKIKIAASRKLTYSPAKAVKELLNGCCGLQGTVHERREWPRASTLSRGLHRTLMCSTERSRPNEIALRRAIAGGGGL